MKSIGRNTVVTRMITVELDKSETVSPDRAFTQTVYRKADGTHWVNHMGGKMEVFLQDDGTFLKPWKAISGISSITGEDVDDMLRERMAEGKQVRIVSHFSGGEAPRLKP